MRTARSDVMSQLITQAWPLVVITARQIHRPVLTAPGLRPAKVNGVSSTTSLADYVARGDMIANKALLHGIPELVNLPGLAHIFPGSFSEEEDNPLRRTANVIYEVDPRDGSADADMRGTSPTILVTFLRRNSSGLFKPEGALVYDVVGDYGIISDGAKIVLAAPDKRGEFRTVQTRRLDPSWTDGNQLILPRRIAYPQSNAHKVLPTYFKDRTVSQVDTGGAGRQTLHIMRRFLAPARQKGCPAFSALPPINVLLNCQPDWKCWDTDPMRVFAQALGLPEPTNIYGRRLRANAANEKLVDMKHRQGCIFVMTTEQRDYVLAVIRQFEAEHGAQSLLLTNYN